MLKYLCSIILGILIYILLNSSDGFSVGGLNPGDECIDDDCYDPPGSCDIVSNRCFCNIDICELTEPHEGGGGGGGAGGGGASTSVSSATAINIDIVDNVHIFTGSFYNAGIPIFVKYIVLTQHDLNSIMAILMTNQNLPPIYLGEFEKLAKSGGSLGRKVSRHFFIIDKKVYYMKKIDGVFEPKNFGLGNEPPILVNNRLYKIATLEIGDDGLVRSILYLQITGTNGVILKMYHSDRSTLELVKNIIDAYIEHIYQKISSCSVSVTSSGTVVGDVTISLDHLSDGIAPNYSIDTSESIVCQGISSVYRVDYFDKVEIESELDTNILEIDGYISSDVREKLRVLVYDDSILLKYIKIITQGGFGVVCVASNIPFDKFASYSDTTGDAALAIAFKIYMDKVRSLDPSGQNDPEIEFINRINDTETNLNNCLAQGEIINARILTDPNDYKMAIMRYMDGDLYSLLEHAEYNREGNLPFQIANRLMIALLCVQNSGYDYTDLKSDNILYRCYKGNKLVISLGDIGSLTSRENKQAPWTAYTIERYFAEGLGEGSFNRSLSVVFLYGLVILEVYRIVYSWKKMDRIDKKILILHYKFCKSMRNCGKSGGPLNWYLTSIYNYYQYIMRYTIPELNIQFDALKNGTNDREIDFIKNLLSRIFVKEDSRITLEEINVLFTQFNHGGAIQCNDIDTEEKCRETAVCTWDATQSPPCN